MGVASEIPKAMHKAKPSSAAQRILPKKWRTKAGRMPNIPSQSIWTPEGTCTWCQFGGRKIVLGNTTLLKLSEAEIAVIKKVALAKLQAINLGCNITVPKDGANQKRSKRTTFSLRRVYRTNSGNLPLSSFLESFKKEIHIKDKPREKENKNVKESGKKVFGIPLSECISHDREAKQRRSSRLQERRNSLDSSDERERRQRTASFSSSGSVDNICETSTQTDTDGESSEHGIHSSESLPETQSSSILDALFLSTSAPVTRSDPSLHGIRRNMEPRVPQVPHIVDACFKHLETYGLRVLGIFRVGSSKKRVKQLREEFDSGKDVKLNEEHVPHDVAALLKEYFRDLPEPLLSRDLYSAFIATRKLKTRASQLKALGYLVMLLPVPHRDTLYALVRFLNEVIEHSTDSVDDNGQLLHGNKMDAHNLATLFGPNILNKAKGVVAGDFQVESLDRAEERKEVISTVQDIITHYEKVFEVPAEIHDETLRSLVLVDPDAVDYILRHLTEHKQICIEIDPDSACHEESDAGSEPPSPCPSPSSRLFRARTIGEALLNRGQQQQHKPLCTSRSADPSYKTHNKDLLSVPARRSHYSDMKHHYRRSCPPGSLVPESNEPSQDTDSEDFHSIRARKTNLTIAVPAELSGSQSSGYNSLQSPSRDVGSTGTFESYRQSSSPFGSSPRNFDNFENSLSPPASPNVIASGSNSPRPESKESGMSKQATSSMARPLGILVTDVAQESNGSRASPTEWQRERWRHWEIMAAKTLDEQETLV